MQTTVSFPPLHLTSYPPATYPLLKHFHVKIFNTCVGAPRHYKIVGDIQYKHYQGILSGSNDSLILTPMLNHCFHCKIYSCVFGGNPTYVICGKSPSKYTVQADNKSLSDSEVQKRPVTCMPTQIF